MFSNVVLPQPDGPRTLSSSPFFKVKLMSFKASTLAPVCWFAKVMHKSVHLRSAKRDPLYQSRKTRLAKALFFLFSKFAFSQDIRR
jgi:hypothetical protein